MNPKHPGKRRGQRKDFRSEPFIYLPSNKPVIGPMLLLLLMFGPFIFSSHDLQESSHDRLKSAAPLLEPPTFQESDRVAAPHDREFPEPLFPLR